ncbi:MAG: GNAT family N-acetyltransferase [Sphingobium sp.]|nr:GNAT family N-acetyltransferase [Sphingobium sp.]
MTIRRATLADLDALAVLFDAYRVFYKQPSDLGGARTFLSERFERNESVIFIAADDSGHPLGFTQLYPSFTSAGMKRIYILNDLFVAEGNRRQGIATTLLEAAAQFARESGAARLALSTAFDNAAAQSVYEAHGWLRDEHFYSYNLKLG